MTPKDLTKLFAILCLLSAVLMAGWGAYESFSQSATSKNWDWALRTYLSFASLTYAGLLFTANNGADRIKVFGLKIKWWLLYFIACVSFYFVSATNVSDYSIAKEDYDNVKVLAHMIFTFIAALSSSLIGWHYFKKGSYQSKMARMSILVGDLLFAGSLISKHDWLTTAIGEACVTFFILAVVWVMINEIVPDRMLNIWK